MDFLVSLVYSPLSKALEVCFVTGFITAYRLESSKHLRGGVLALPGWHKKKAHKKRRAHTQLMRVRAPDFASAPYRFCQSLLTNLLCILGFEAFLT